MKYTKESLQNTWGVVESKEHAEFIIELCKANGLGFYEDDVSRMFFTFNEDSMLFFFSAEDDLYKSRCKQIIIPLPPKAKDWPRDKSSDIPQNEKRNKSKQAYEILKSLDYEYDLDKQKWFKKEYINDLQ